MCKKYTCYDCTFHCTDLNTTYCEMDNRLISDGYEEDENCNICHQFRLIVNTFEEFIESEKEDNDTVKGIWRNIEV